MKASRAIYQKLVIACVALTLSGLIVLHFLSDRSGHSVVQAIGPPTRPAPKMFKELLALPVSEIGNQDVALLNLLSAQDLPGAEQLIAENYLATLDQWAARVKSETERHLYRFRNQPAEFENSEAYFRMLIIAVVLYEDFGVRYNPERAALPSTVNLNDHFFADSRDIFLHGLIGDRRMGTCSSMPVLYAAIGRRLGYPLKLVTTKAHLFLRWEDANERFDLEATGKGMNRYTDEHFRQWPFQVTEEEVKAEGYLRSLTPAEELAVFLSIRGLCQQETKRYSDAVESFKAAARLSPGCRSYKEMGNQLERQSAWRSVR